MQAIIATNLSKCFASCYAVRSITLTAAPRSTVLLVGPNGAGKTTLLRLLATAVRPSSGHASIFGHDLVADADTVRGFSAYFGTAHGLYNALTAHENLTFAAAMSGRLVPPETWLGRFGLAAVAHVPVRTFSQGMKRRLGIARLSFFAPRLLLLDEPFTGLDRDGNHLIETLIGEVKSRDGCVVLATHDWERGLQLADTVVALAGGRQVDAGSALAVSATVEPLMGGRR